MALARDNHTDAPCYTACNSSSDVTTCYESGETQNKDDDALWLPLIRRVSEGVASPRWKDVQQLGSVW